MFLKISPRRKIQLFFRLASASLLFPPITSSVAREASAEAAAVVTGSDAATVVAVDIIAVDLCFPFVSPSRMYRVAALEKTQFSHGAFSGRDPSGRFPVLFRRRRKTKKILFSPFFLFLLASLPHHVLPDMAIMTFKMGEEEEEEEVELGRDDIIRRNREEREREGMGDSRAKEPRKKRKEGKAPFQL